MILNEVCLSFIPREVKVTLAFISIYAGSLLVMRFLKILKKRNCPTCSGKIKRKRKNIGDKLLVGATFFILPFRGYKCIHCGWEGVRWNVYKHKSKKTGDEDLD